MAAAIWMIDAKCSSHRGDGTKMISTIIDLTPRSAMGYAVVASSRCPVHRRPQHKSTTAA